MNEKSNPNRSRRAKGSRRKTSQLHSSQTRGKEFVAEKGQGGRKNPLAGRRSGRVHQETEGGTVTVAFIQPMKDPGTGREWERVFLFEVENEEDIAAAEAWLERNYPPSKEGRQ